MSGLTENESKIIFDGIAKVGEIAEEMAAMKMDINYIKEKISNRKTDARYYITTLIAFIGIGIAILKAFGVIG